MTESQRVQRVTAAFLLSVGLMASGFGLALAPVQVVGIGLAALGFVAAGAGAWLIGYTAVVLFGLLGGRDRGKAGRAMQSPHWSRFVLVRAWLGSLGGHLRHRARALRCELFGHEWRLFSGGRTAYCARCAAMGLPGVDGVPSAWLLPRDMSPANSGGVLVFRRRPFLFDGVPA